WSLSSRARSALSLPLSLTNDQILPQRPATNRRFEPGAWARSSGSSNFGSFGNAGSVLYGGGGSGKPFIFELVQGTRLSRPNGLRTGSAACEGQNTKRPPTMTAERRRKLRMGWFLFKIDWLAVFYFRSRSRASRALSCHDACSSTGSTCT